MPNTVFCRKYQANMEAMARPPYPGPKGQAIFSSVSKQAWQAWLAHQTMLINEKHLNMVDPASREYLAGEMEKFLSGEDYDQAEGYVAPTTMNTHTALLIIDVQQGFDFPVWGPRNNPQAENNIALLLAHWRRHGWPVVNIQHASTEANSPLNPHQEGFHFKACAVPKAKEPIFTKSVNSAFIGTGLEDYLHAKNIKSLVIVGLTTDHCVSTTTRMAGNLGFAVKLVADATATFDKQDRYGNHIDAQLVHEVHLASLDEEFCHVVDTERLLGH